MRDGFAEAHFGVGLEFRENHRGNFRRAELLGLTFDFDLDRSIAIGGANYFVGDTLGLFGNLIKFAAHEPFDRVDGISRIGDGLAFGRFADQTLAGFAKRDY